MTQNPTLALPPGLMTVNQTISTLWPEVDLKDRTSVNPYRLRIFSEIRKGKQGRFPGAIKPGSDWYIPEVEVTRYKNNPPAKGRPATVNVRRNRQPYVNKLAAMERRPATFGEIVIDGMFESSGKVWTKVEPAPILVDGVGNARRYKKGPAMYARFEDSAEVVALIHAVPETQKQLEAKRAAKAKAKAEVEARRVAREARKTEEAANKAAKAAKKGNK